MTGSELVRRLRRLGRKRGVNVTVDTRRGKGDHRTVRFGTRHTVLGGLGELPKGTLAGMLKQPGLTLDDLRE